MLKKGMADTKAQMFANFLFMAVFFGCRVVHGPRR